MNNHEAKRVILEADSCFCLHGAYKDCHSGCKYREALDAAVKALEQEPKPMVEIDLYSVIKQKYIERKVLDKISAEIERQEKWLMDAGYNQYNVDISLDAIKSVVDKYRSEVEPQESEE